MGTFLKSFVGGFFGRVLAALFIAVCALFGFGPDRWAAVMIGDLPIPLVVARIAFLALGVIAFTVWLTGRLSFGLRLKPDMTIADVTNYMVNDSSVELKKPKPAEIAQFGRAKGKLLNWPGIGHQDALARVQTALNNGILDAWGCRELKPGGNATFNFEQWQRPIPKEYWESAYLDSFFCFHTTNKMAQTAPLPGKNAERYSGIMMNKRQVKLTWPPNPWWRRILADLRFIRRKNYFGKEIDSHYRPTELG